MKELFNKLIDLAIEINDYECDSFRCKGCPLDKELIDSVWESYDVCDVVWRISKLEKMT